jgi:ubiquinone/menaquinone biosynthesis C-methylase UbiE
LLVGIDISSGMMERAYSNLRKANELNVRFYQMSSDNLQFPDGFFDVISSCHAPFYVTEVAKVLKNGGTFLTQQVSEADKLNLKRAFGRGHPFIFKTYLSNVKKPSHINNVLASQLR